MGGEVDAGDLRALLEGRRLRMGERLGRRFGEVSARGFDVTFSAPKSVSTLWAVTPDPWVRGEVLAAHDSAVTAAFDWSRPMAPSPDEDGTGYYRVDTRGATAALFRPRTSGRWTPSCTPVR